MINFFLWIFEIEIQYCHHEATGPDLLNFYGPQPERMFITIWLGGEDITDDVDEEDYKDIERLCYADKEINQWSDVA